MDRFRFGDNRLKSDAVVGLVLGVLAAYILQVRLPIGLGGHWIITTLIVGAVGGLWYHVRKVL